MVIFKRNFFIVVSYILLLLLLINVLFPFYWMFATSLKTRQAIHTRVPELLPMKPTIDNYVKVFAQSNFGMYINNSLIVTVTSSLIVLIVSVLGGYALARYNFKGKKAEMIIFLASQMIPLIVAIIPMFVLYSKIGLINRLGSLIVSYTASNIPFCLITMSSFFKHIPVSLEEAATIDGCSRFQAVVRIVLPVMLPGIVAVFVFAFTGCWNELFYATMMISTDSRRTIPAGLMNFVQKYDIDWGQMCAAGIITLLPVTIMFFFVQKYIVTGLTQGAVKG